MVDYEDGDEEEDTETDGYPDDSVFRQAFLGVAGAGNSGIVALPGRGFSNSMLGEDRSIEADDRTIGWLLVASCL